MGIPNAFVTTWREMLTEAMEKHGESWADVVEHTMSEQQLDARFDSSFGAEEGCPFTLWTAKHVYFPTAYDGSEDVGVVSRHPDGVPTPHIQ